MGNRSVLLRVKISPFFRLKKLGPYGEGRSIPPQTPKQVGPTGFFPDSAHRGKIRAPLLQIEPVAALRNAPVAHEALFGGRPTKM